MIDLALRLDGPSEVPAFVCKIVDKVEKPETDMVIVHANSNNASLTRASDGTEFTISGVSPNSLIGDVLLVQPAQSVATRLIRKNSRHNTLLFTEQCDQLCVMCSQPPRRIEDSWRINFYKQAVKLADPNVTIGISGGEPTLQRELFFDFLDSITTSRPDITFHILTNAQHFRDEDISLLQTLNGRANILWGVPLYSANAEVHDQIVCKPGAFEVLLPNLYRMARGKCRIELRTVVTALNFPYLPSTADFLSKYLFFIDFWAVMGLEPTGFAKAFRGDLFVDHSVHFGPLGRALEIVQARGMDACLYNFPLCTVPPKFRTYCSDSISDWKKKFISNCDGCNKKDVCSGFFEWYNGKWSFEKVSPLH